MKKLISSLLLIVLICLSISSCGGSCKAKDDTKGQTESSTVASTPLESPSSTTSKTEESTSPESTPVKTPAPETDSNFHYHEFNHIWLNDEDLHWHKCDLCIGTTQKEPHELELHTVLTQPSADSAGQAIFTCKICNYSFIGELLYTPAESK